MWTWGSNRLDVTQRHLVSFTSLHLWNGSRGLVSLSWFFPHGKNLFLTVVITSTAGAGLAKNQHTPVPPEAWHCHLLQFQTVYRIIIEDAKFIRDCCPSSLADKRLQAAQAAQLLRDSFPQRSEVCTVSSSFPLCKKYIRSQSASTPC